jgi:hypothetical protein
VLVYARHLSPPADLSWDFGALYATSSHLYGHYKGSSRKMQVVSERIIPIFLYFLMKYHNFYSCCLWDSPAAALRGKGGKNKKRAP